MRFEQLRDVQLFDLIISVDQPVGTWASFHRAELRRETIRPVKDRRVIWHCSKLFGTGRRIARKQNSKPSLTFAS